MTGQPAAPVPMVDAALYYAANDVPVFPCWPARGGLCGCGRDDCKSPGKHPIPALAPEGVKNATTDPRVIRACWTFYPDANIGLATGRGYMVLDVDGEEGKASLAALQWRHGQLPPTVATVTGSGGWHLFYALPPGRTVRNSAGKLGSKLDTRGAGGYIIAPPSIHASGRRYAFLPGYEPWAAPFAVAPGWLLELLERPADPVPAARTPWRVAGGPGTGRAYAEGALRRAAVRVATAAEGGRNDTLNREAFSLSQFVTMGELPASRLVGELASAALAAGLGRHEVGRTLASALRSRVAPGPVYRSTAVRHRVRAYAAKAAG